jgi:hypothetical protein
MLGLGMEVGSLTRRNKKKEAEKEGEVVRRKVLFDTSILKRGEEGSRRGVKICYLRYSCIIPDNKFCLSSMLPYQTNPIE